MIRLFALVMTLMLAVPSFAAPPILSAPDAQAQIEAGDMILLDIRSRGEWQQTGLAKGAWPVSMHEQDFGLRISALLERYRPEQIAIICATGGRTARVADLFERNGIIGVTDISEGMMGNRSGPGWIARGMPIVTLEAAQQAYDAALAE